MCLYRQDSEYVPGSKYTKILSMAVSEYVRVLNMRALHNVLIMPEYPLTEL